MFTTILADGPVSKMLLVTLISKFLTKRIVSRPKPTSTVLFTAIPMTILTVYALKTHLEVEGNHTDILQTFQDLPAILINWAKSLSTLTTPLIGKQMKFMSE